MSTEFIVESFVSTVKRGEDQIRASISSVRTRLVWFVGIAAFALIEGRSLPESLASKEYIGLDVLWVSIPWLLAASLAVVSHFLTDKAELRWNAYFTNKLALLDLHKVKLYRGETDSVDFSAIINDDDPDLTILRSKSDDMARFVNRFENLSFACLVLGFIWSVIYPLLFT